MIQEIEVDELEVRLQGGSVTLIDVRMPDEFDQQRVPGAVLIPLPDLPQHFESLTGDADVLVICQSGGRSLRACEFLASKGITAINIAGGTMAWAQSGRAVESGPIQP
ncbi:MAG: rhodanese-like domain-containing protein [Microthrixaceae bacterium]|nr:rhodanese-like domain-containing protein [Microthrixaceae bacterium]